MARLPAWLAKAREGWQNTGARRPPFAIEPDAGQESVWDYPRPPRLEPDGREVIVGLGEVVVARSRRSMRVLETSHPPTFYLPPEDVVRELLVPAGGGSICEWKGEASYFDVVAAGERLERAAWCYVDPFDEFRALAGYVSFYPARLSCLVGGVAVQPQAGGFYGGWVTPEVVGPFKGEPGTSGW